MAVIDSLVVRGEFDPTGFAQGFAEAEREHAAFIQRTATRATVIPLEVKLNGAAGAQADLRQLDDAAKALAASIAGSTQFDLGRLADNLAVSALQFRATSTEARAFQSLIEQLRAAQVNVTGQVEVAGATETILEVDHLSDALADAGQRTRDLVAAARVPVRLDTSASIVATDTLIARLNLARRTVADVRTILSAPPASSGPRLLASQDDTSLAQSAEANASATRRMGEASAQAAIQAEVLSASTRTALDVQARFARASAQAATGLTAQAAAGAAAARATAAAAAAGAGPFAAAAAGSVASANAIAASTDRVKIGIDRMNVGLAAASRQLVILAAAEAAAATGAGRMAAGFAGASTQRVAQDATATAGALGNIGTRAAGSVTGLRTMGATLTALGAQTLGAHGQVAQLAQQILFLGAGGAAVVGVAGAVLGLSVVYRFLTTAQREAREEQDRLVQSLLTEADAAVPAAVRALAALTAAREAARRAEQGFLSRAGGTAAGVITTLISPADAGIAAAAELRRRDTKDRLDAARAVGQAEKNLAASIRGDQERTVRTLTEGITLRRANSAETQTARDYVALLARQEQAANLPLVERIALQQQLRGLRAALNDDAVRAAERAQGSTRRDDALALTQQELKGQEDALRASLARDEITRQQFAERRRQLAGAAAAADIAAFQKAIAAEATSGRAGDDPDEVTRRLATMDHLRAQIVLRRTALAQALEQIAHEERLIEVLALQEQRRARIAQLGGGNIIAGAGGVAGGNIPSPSLIPALEVPLILRPALQREAFGTGVGDEIQAELSRAESAANGLAQALQDVDLALKDIGNANITGPSAALNALNDAVHEVTRGLDQVVGAAVGVGLIGENAARSIGSVLSLADALASVAASASTGNILGAVGAGIGVLGAVFGKSEAAIARDEAIRSNTEALRELRGALSEAARGAGGAAQVGRAAGAIGAEGGETAQFIKEMERFFGGGEAAGQEAAFKFLDDEARRFGVTFADLQRVAADNGIQLLDKKGNIVASAFDDLAEATRLAGEAARRFSTDIGTQQRLLATEDKLGIGGRSTDEGVANLQRIRQIQLDNLALSDAEEARVRSIDLSTKEGQEAYKAWQISLLKAAKAGELTDDQLGGFGGVDDLLPTIDQAADGLIGLSDAAKDAADRMRDFNLPSGFRAAALAFRTADAGGPTLPPPPPLAPAPFTPPLPPGAIPGSDGARAPDFAAVSVDTITITVNAAPGQSEEEIAQLVMRKFREIANAQSGDTLNFSFN